MGHRDKVKKLGRTKSHREAMLSNMAMSLFTHRVIKTTDSKAKALKPIVDRIITTAKENTLHAKRQVARTITNKEVFTKLFTEIIPQFSERNSGFARVIKLGVRRGDGAPLSVVELLTEKPKEEIDTKAKKGKKTVKTTKSSAVKTPKAPGKEDKTPAVKTKTSGSAAKKTTPSIKNK